MTPRKLATALAASGRPTKTKEMLAIFRALVAAGASDSVAYSATCLAYDIAAGYNWKVKDISECVRFSMRRDHADRHPDGQWARLFSYHGHAAWYLSDHDKTVRDWCTLPGPRAAVAADFEVQS